VRPHVRRFHVHVGECRRCSRRVEGRDARQTTDALGAASTHLGPHAVAYIVLLNKYLGLSHAKIAAVLEDWFRLTLRRARSPTRCIGPRGRRRGRMRHCLSRCGQSGGESG
jgi:hypothetical protein